jgi:hypothetical protein
MILLPRHKGSVAEWTFKNGFVQHLHLLALEYSLASCATVVSILRDHRLLFPNTVCFSQWMRAGMYEVAQSERVEKAEIKLSVDPLNPFVDMLSRCRSYIENESVYPLTVKFIGSLSGCTRRC